MLQELLKDEREGNQGRREYLRNPENSDTPQLFRMLAGACNTIDRLLDELERVARNDSLDPVP